MGGHVFTDGSCGAETKDPRLRRCDFGIAWIFSEGGLLSTLGGRAGILHGRNQSVARAKLRLSMKATRQVFIWTDCMFVINGFARGRRRKHLSHADLWEEFGPQSCSTKSGEVTPPRRRWLQGSLHHWKHMVTRLHTNWPREELCGTPSPWSMLPQPATQTVE